MHIDPLIVELADRNTRKWPEIVRRAEILHRYADVGRLTAEQLTSCARELGCRERQAYNWIRAFRARSLGQPDPRSNVATSKRTSPGATENDASPNPEDPGRDGAAAAHAADSPAVLTHRQRFGASAALRGRLRLHDTVHAILDGAGLDLVVEGSRSRTAQAFLLALVDVDDGTLLAHRLIDGPPTKEDVSAVLASLSDPATALVVRSAAIRDDMIPDVVPTGSGSLDLPSGNRPRPGFPLHAVMGSMIGRIRIISRGQPRVDQGEAVPIGIAAKALGLLVERHNEAIAGERPDPLRS